MSDTFDRIREHVVARRVKVSDHALTALADDAIVVAAAIAGLHASEVVEDYPDAKRGPSVLVLSIDQDGQPVHVVWGMAKDNPHEAVMITAYRPDPALWSTGFLIRRKS